MQTPAPTLPSASAHVVWLRAVEPDFRKCAERHESQRARRTARGAASVDD